MAHGGPRTGAGRKPKSRTRLSMKAVEQAEKTGELPHEFLLRVARGEPIGDYLPEIKERIDAAKWAAPYFAPKLSATDVNAAVSFDNRTLQELSDSDLMAIVLNAAGKTKAT